MKTTNRPDGSTDPTGSNAVRIEGKRTRTVPATVPEAERVVGDLENRTAEFRCVSGRRISGTWRGVPLDVLLEAAGMAPSTTHVVVEAIDGHTVCVDVVVAMDTFLALEAVNPTETGDQTPRIVSPELDGPRSVKRVTRIEAVHLEPGHSPDAVEQFEPGRGVGAGEGER